MALKALLPRGQGSDNGTQSTFVSKASSKADLSPAPSTQGRNSECPKSMRKRSHLIMPESEGGGQAQLSV